MDNVHRQMRIVSNAYTHATVGTRKQTHTHQPLALADTLAISTLSLVVCFIPKEESFT